MQQSMPLVLVTRGAWHRYQTAPEFTAQHLTTWPTYRHIVFDPTHRKTRTTSSKYDSILIKKGASIHVSVLIEQVASIHPYYSFSMKWLMYGILFLPLSDSLEYFCPWTFFLKNGLGKLPWTPSRTKQDYKRECFRLSNWLSLPCFGAVDEPFAFRVLAHFRFLFETGVGV